MRTLTLLLSGLLFFIVGCSKDDTTSPTKETTGNLKVLLIDAPAAYDAVNIVIDSVQAHISNSDTLTGWYTLNKTPQTQDLLKLANGASAIIGSATVPAGMYSQIRMFIGSGSNVVVNGTAYALTVPSGAQTGMKINVHAEIKADITYELILDFDANKSVKLLGNNNYKLEPVIQHVSSPAVTGLFTGTIQPAAQRSTIWAFASADSFSTVSDTTTGAFKLAYLVPGTYSVRVVPYNNTYRDTLITGKTIVAGSTTALGIIALTQK